MERSPAAPRSGEEWSIECLQVGRLYPTAYTDTPLLQHIPESKEKDSKNLSSQATQKVKFYA